MNATWMLLLWLGPLATSCPAADEIFPERQLTDTAARAFFAEVDLERPELAKVAVSVRQRTYHTAILDLSLEFARETPLRPLLAKVEAEDFSSFQLRLERWAGAGSAGGLPPPTTLPALLLDLAAVRRLSETNRLTGPAALLLWRGVFQAVRGAEKGAKKNPTRAALVRVGIELGFFQRVTRWRKLAASRKFVLPSRESPEGAMLALLEPAKQP